MTVFLPSGRTLRTRTKARYILVRDDPRSGGPPWIGYYTDGLHLAEQRRLPNDIIMDLTTGLVVR